VVSITTHVPFGVETAPQRAVQSVLGDPNAGQFDRVRVAKGGGR